MQKHLYRIIHNDLKNRIYLGVYHPCAPLPPEIRLNDKSQMSMTTIGGPPFSVDEVLIPFSPVSHLPGDIAR